MNKEHLYDSDFKIKHLGYGEWVEEPDLVKFSHNGYECMVYRVIQREPLCQIEAYFGGHFCGYVRIPVDHPYYLKEYEDMGISCHFGISFGEVCEPHWIGFDCGHSGDLIPSMEKMKKERGYQDMFPIPEQFKDRPLLSHTYRNMDYCIEQCKSIVDQLAEINQNKQNVNTELDEIIDQTSKEISEYSKVMKKHFGY
jgi:hypothetical protein